MTSTLFVAILLGVSGPALPHPSEDALPRHPMRTEVSTRSDEVLGTRIVNWDAIAECESSGDWATNTGLFEGGLQFLPSTWDAYRPGGFPDAAYQATRTQQILVGERVLDAQGPGAWPNCWPGS